MCVYMVCGSVCHVCVYAVCVCEGVCVVYLVCGSVCRVCVGLQCM